MKKEIKIKEQQHTETIYQCDFCGTELPLALGISSWDRISDGKKDFCNKLCKKLYGKSPKQLKRLFEIQTSKRKEIIAEIRNKISELL